MRIPPVPAIPAGLIALTVAAATLTAPSSAHSPPLATVARQTPGAACSLTPAQERTALDAFDKMLPVLTHPRCLNCHGGLNPYVDPLVGRHLGGAMVDSVTHEPLRADACVDCHGELPGWDTPGEAMFFVGRSPRDLCIQFKEFAPQGGQEFVTHITHEPHGPQFIATAFLGRRALNTMGEVTYEEATGHPLTAEKPPGTHQQLIADATRWANAIGSGWNETPACGCELGGEWHGTVTAHAVFEDAGMPGTMTITSSATVMLERVPTPGYASGRRVQVYQATGGTVRWDALVSGGCRGNAGGTLPLDEMDVDGNPMLELRLDQDANGSLTYQPTTGSQPELWSPIFNVQCTMGGQSVALPTTNLLPTWWHYDIPNPPVSADLNRLKGSYRWAPTPGTTVLWQWDLKRIQ